MRDVRDQNMIRQWLFHAFSCFFHAFSTRLSLESAVSRAPGEGQAPIPAHDGGHEPHAWALPNSTGAYLNSLDSTSMWHARQCQEPIPWPSASPFGAPDSCFLASSLTSEPENGRFRRRSHLPRQRDISKRLWRCRPGAGVVVFGLSLI